MNLAGFKKASTDNFNEPWAKHQGGGCAVAAEASF